MSISDAPPQLDLPAAAQWLRARHPSLDHLITRACGESETWVEDLVDAFNALSSYETVWADYERSSGPAPRDDARYDAWLAAGPELTHPAAQRLAPMSGGETRLLRLLTTLGQARCHFGWHLEDLSFDDGGWAVVKDWVAIVEAQR